jgi:hypothetical protein
MTNAADFVDPYGSTWRQDPASGRWSRWDGSQWTTAGKQPPGFGQPPPPMTGYQTVATPRRRHRIWPWVLGSIGVVIIAIVVLVAVVVDHVAHDLTSLESKHAITQTQFDAVKLGTSQPAVEAQLGKTPQDTSTFVNQGILKAGQISGSCLLYNETGHVFGTFYEFCFSTGALTNKHSYTY